MAKKFRGVEIIEQIDEALDLGLARFLILTQGKLSKSSPIDSGRLASSFFIGQGVPNRSVPAEKPKGAAEVSITKPSQKITMENDWWISSSLPYSERTAFDPRWAKGGRGGGAAWFTKIANGLDKDAERAFSYFLKKVK